MKLGAIQKTTLLDYPGMLACTVFFAGCNLRCPFCHNAGLVLPEQISLQGVSREELLTFLSSRVGKLDGVCLSGGEPTLYADLPELIDVIRQMGFRVKLDTNGTNPQMLHDLIRCGLVDYIAMDIKNCPQRYQQTCGGVDVLEQVQESADLLLHSDVPYEFRTTVCSPLHTPEGMHQIGQWLHGAAQYFLQPFVDSGNLVGSGISPLTQTQIHTLQQTMCADIPNTRIRGI